MRRTPNPLVLISVAALAAPVIVKAAKPAAKKLGKGIQKLGEKLVESVENMEKEEKHKGSKSKKSTASHEHGPGATPPDEGAETHVPDPTEAPAGNQPDEVAPTETPKEAPVPDTPDEVAPTDVPKEVPKKATKVKQSKPAPKKRASKSGSKTVKAKRATRRKTRDVGETG